MLQKLVQMGLLNPIFANHLEDIESVNVSLVDRNGPLHMAVYRIRPEIGVLIWVGRFPGDVRPNGQLIFLDREGQARLRFMTVGHLYGWPSRTDEIYEQAEAEIRAQGNPDDEFGEALNAAVHAAQAVHHRPVADAVAEACKRLGLTTLCKWDGYFVWGEIPGVTLLSDANWGQGEAGRYMTQFGTYQWSTREGPKPVWHFLVPATEGAG